MTLHFDTLDEWNRALEEVDRKWSHDPFCGQAVAEWSLVFRSAPTRRLFREESKVWEQLRKTPAERYFESQDTQQNKGEDMGHKIYMEDEENVPPGGKILNLMTGGTQWFFMGTSALLLLVMFLDMFLFIVSGSGAFISWDIGRFFILVVYVILSCAIAGGLAALRDSMKMFPLLLPKRLCDYINS